MTTILDFTEVGLFSFEGFEPIQEEGRGTGEIDESLAFGRGGCSNYRLEPGLEFGEEAALN